MTMQDNLKIRISPSALYGKKTYSDHAQQAGNHILYDPTLSRKE